MLQLAPDNRKATQIPADAEGTVVVKIFLAWKGHQAVKGNITRTIRLTGKVTEVYDAIMGLCNDEIH